MNLRMRRHYGLISALIGVVALALVVACAPRGDGLTVAPVALAAGSTAQSGATVPEGATTATAVVQPTSAATAASAAGEASGATGTTVTSSSTGSSLSLDGVAVRLNGDTISVDGTGVTVSGSKATITAGGTYVVSGKLTDGQIIVDADKQKVALVLNGVEISCSNSAPIYVRDADWVTIYLAEGTERRVVDGTQYVLEEGDEPNAAIFSAADLAVDGTGSLTVVANYNDGICSKDELVIYGGTIQVTAEDDGLRGKDSVTIESGTLTVEAGGDGIKSDNDEDNRLGYIQILGGELEITSGGDGLDAATTAEVRGGSLNLTAGGGSTARIDSDLSAKGIKGDAQVIIAGGTITINAADDAVHSNGSIVVNGGTMEIQSGDDGMHADASLEINDGEIWIRSSYEGLESAVVTVNGGNVHIGASDDGINITGGNDGSGMQGPGGGGRPGDTFAATGDYHLYIHGGYIFVDARGDGIDSNGTIEMTAGTVIVNGPTENMNGALDFGTFNISGGLLVAVGSSGMAMAPSRTSSQAAVLINLSGTIKAGTLMHFQDQAGEDILTFAATRQYQSIVLSSADLTVGETYTLYYGGSSTGTATDGLYKGGTYSGGTELGSYTQSSVVTNLGGRSR